MIKRRGKVSAFGIGSPREQGSKSSLGQHSTLQLRLARIRLLGLQRQRRRQEGTLGKK